MKHTVARISSFIMGVIILCSGCSSDQSVEIHSQETTSVVSSDEPVTTQPQELPEEKSEILDFFEKSGDDCYYLGFSDRFIDGIATLDDETLAVLSTEMTDGIAGSTYLKVLNLKTGEAEEICVDEEGYSTFCAISGHIAVMHTDNGNLTVYSKDLEKTDEHAFSLGNDDALFLTRLDDTLSELHGSDNVIKLVRVDGEGKLQIEEKPYTVEEGFYLEKFWGVLSDGLLVGMEYTSHDERFYLWDTKSNVKTWISPDCPSYNAYVIGSNIVGVNENDLRVNIYSQSHPGIVKSFDYPQGFSASARTNSKNSVYFISNGDDNPSIKRYSLETGLCTGQYLSPENTFGYLACLSEVGEYVAFYATYDENPGVYLWAPEPVEAEEGDFTSLTGGKSRTLALELEASMEKDYGIEIFSGEEAVRYFSGYAVREEKGWANIYNALVEIESVLSRFPEGFFEEMKSAYGEDGSLSIYLTGTIIPDTTYSESISDAAAFTFLEGLSDRVIVVDATQGGIDVTIAHELLHCIEDSVYNKSYSSDSELEMFERWYMLNPEGFSYVGTYTDGNGNTTGAEVTDYIGSSYSAGGEMPLDSVYFVDGYATSYAREDMARIFEYIFFSEDEPLPDYFESINMKLKSAYLCACIREAFRCMEGTEVCWEHSIDPEFTLEYFRENYDLDEYYESLYYQAAG